MMIDDLRAQTKGSVINFLRELGQNTELYSKKCNGLEPLLKNHEIYLFASLKEVVLVALDPRPSRMSELADEEPFNGEDEDPLWFSETTHRTSPVWLLSVQCELLRKRLGKLSHHAPKVKGILLTGSEIINYSDMTDVWNKLNVSVFDRMSGLSKLELPVNADAELAVAESMPFVLEGDYSQDNISDAEKKLRREMKKLYQKSNALFDFDDDEYDLDLSDFFKKYDNASDDASDDATDDTVDDEEIDDCDLNDDVQTQEFSIENRLNDVMQNERQNDSRFVDKVATVALNVSTGNKPSLYADGSVIITLTATKGDYFRIDSFKCYVYTADFYPMGNSVESAEVKRSKGNRLTIDIPSSSIWLPGKYFLLLGDNSGKLQRIDFTLDENLCATMGERKDCMPLSQEDILISSLENNILYWPQLGQYPGAAQFREWVIKRAQLYAYNSYRSSHYRQGISFNSNLLICKCNDDIEERFINLLYDLSGIKDYQFRYVDCGELYDPLRPSPYDSMNEELRSSMNKVVICLANIGAMQGAGGKVIARRVLDLMYNRKSNNILWMCGTRQDVDAILNMYPSFGSLFLKDNRLEQEHYSAFDLIQVFRRRLMKEFLYIPDEVKDALARAIIQSNANQLMNTWSLENVNHHVAEEVCPHYLQHALSTISSEKITELSVDDLCLDRLTAGSSSFEESMRELNQMVGLDNLKKELLTMANTAHLLIERRRRGLKTNDDMVFHSIFTGNPGTGKTTVARQLGRIYHSLGLLSKGEVIEVDRKRLVGRYIGETEQAMVTILEEARGNVLFIDEAYTLYDGADDRKDFGARVIDSLLTVLSQPNPDMLIILAGYEKEMNAMLNTNPGLMGRFPYKYQFADYTAEQLMEIARRLLSKEEYILTDEAEACFFDIIKEELQRKSKNFSNGRWIYQMVKRGIIPNLANRVFTTGGKDLQHIEASDIRLAYESLSPKPVEQEPKPVHKRIKGFCTTIILAAVMMFCGCQQRGEVNAQEPTQAEFVSSAFDSLVSVLDSMIAYRNVVADPTSKASYEWKWANHTRMALGMSEDPIDLDNLDALSFEVDKLYAPLTASSPAEANEAVGVFASTACFRLLNAYHVLADLFSESLDENWFMQDYVLWQGVYSEYEENHLDTFGRNTTYMLGIAYKTLTELRQSSLMEEIGYFDVEHEGAAKWFVEVDEIRWNPEQKAIRLWYDHRMKMADKLGNTNSAEYLRHITLKTVFIYQHLQMGMKYDFENL